MDAKYNGTTYTIVDTIFSRSKVRMHDRKHGECDILDFAYYHIQNDGPPSNNDGLKKIELEKFLSSEAGQEMALLIEAMHDDYYKARDAEKENARMLREDPKGYVKMLESMEVVRDEIEEVRKKT